ncbi:hypothetical protein L1987_26314 [Smallanthus sonchifolius]|uniref:Uncharacterized protein n=1 Tax=Smallanthus sonchifolius TaxID=185202 RepID=A0ACB9IB69_9ASTR|nr:hypothetical protein L1987_26314 [Smallanthus sonchifolius]
MFKKPSLKNRNRALRQSSLWSPSIMLDHTQLLQRSRDGEITTTSNWFVCDGYQNPKSDRSLVGYERLEELKKIGQRVEQEIYAASQSEYSRKICFMMLTMETRLQNPVRSNSNSVAFDSTAQTGDPNGGDWQEEVYQKIKAMKDLYLLDLTAPTCNPSGQDWQEEVYQKIKAMKDLYLPDLSYMHQKILSRLHQHDSLPQQPKNEYLEKLKVFKNMLERFMQFLQIPKHEILASYKDKLGTYEKQIINVINSYRWKPAAPQQQAQALPPPHMQSLQQSQETHSQSSTQVQSHENPMNLQGSMAQMLQSNKMPIQQQNQQSSANLLLTQVQQSQLQLPQQVMPHMQSQPCQLQQQPVGMQQHPNLLQWNTQQRLVIAGGFQQQNVINMQKRLCPQKRAMPEPSSTSLDSTAQTGNPNGEDWQEEVYQKVKAMKDLYLLDLNGMHQKILSKLQQQPKSEHIEKLKVFKNMLERFMQFLIIPKHGILASYKDRLGTYEKQIINVINSNRRKPAAPQQQAQA